MVLLKKYRAKSTRSERLGKAISKGVFRCFLVVGLFAFVAVLQSLTLFSQQTSNAHSNYDERRKLNVTTNSTYLKNSLGGCEDTYAKCCEHTGNPPYYLPIGTGAFTCAQLSSGAIILPILGMMYMFVALAIICDDFFVPSLDEAVEVLDISDDVAGATLMAGGGSAPELFTSFIGTFLSSGSVGFGTIVGSAVFNVLFVIGMCAMFSKGTEPLQLTWWPLFRDCFYYIIALTVLALCFVGENAEISIGESVLLLLLYIGYVVFMKYNEVVHQFLLDNVLPKTFMETSNPLVEPVDEEKKSITDEITTRYGRGKVLEARKDGSIVIQLPFGKLYTFNASIRKRQRHSIAVQAKMEENDHKSQFRFGFVKMLIRTKTLLETAELHYVAEVAGDVRETFDKVSGDNGLINFAELKAVVQDLEGSQKTDEEVQKIMDKIDDDKDGSINFEEFEKWYSTSESRLRAEADIAFELIDADGNGNIDRDELREVFRRLGREPNKDELTAMQNELDANKDGQITKDEFKQWYDNSLFFKQRLAEVEFEHGDRETCYPAFPTSTNGDTWALRRAQLMYLVTLPIILVCYTFIPDTQKDRQKHLWPLAFISSIFWIGLSSYFMVWWATQFGGVLSLPDEIMGLTFLAAGTSVPDLFSSVIVAQQGKGDMAVSSSIGSNIFDVLIGLPLPWFIYSCYYGKAVVVSAPTLVIDVLVLLFMVATVIGTVAYCDWKMSKVLGGVMFFLYILFIAQSLIRSTVAAR
eukprot:g428.t1